MRICQMMLHTLVFKQKLKKKILMPMTFNSFQTKEVIENGVIDIKSSE